MNFPDPDYSLQDPFLGYSVVLMLLLPFQACFDFDVLVGLVDDHLRQPWVQRKFSPLKEHLILVCDHPLSL